MSYMGMQYLYVHCSATHTFPTGHAFRRGKMHRRREGMQIWTSSLLKYKSRCEWGMEKNNGCLLSECCFGGNASPNALSVGDWNFYRSLSTPFWGRPNSPSACLGSLKLPKKFRKIKKKIVKALARFSENVLIFCRPHPTSVEGEISCGSIFGDTCPRKNIWKFIQKRKTKSSKCRKKY